MEFLKCSEENLEFKFKKLRNFKNLKCMFIIEEKIIYVNMYCMNV